MQWLQRRGVDVEVDYMPATNKDKVTLNTRGRIFLREINGTFSQENGFWDHTEPRTDGIL
jgi:hypothetical protein